MSRAAQHYDTTEWVDFVRDQVPAARSAEMRAHVESGCARCAQLQSQFARLVAIGAHERRYFVPIQTERVSKALFSLNQQSSATLVQRLVGALVYDSFTMLAPAGVRVGHQISRYMLYEAGDYSLDLHFEHEKGSDTIVLAGQIINRRNPEEVPAYCPVILRSEDKELGRSISNGYGEFQMRYAPQPDLCLHVPISARGQELEVPLERAGHSSAA